ncbi:RodZ domain-containing protein [Pseudaeromonas sp. ZJS20]|uniref:RodZ domain-containing protein n=1 Tax=Pseudaeromonas aegiceratis TaxID=3153928 RepID=UPI00390C8FBB
MTTESHTVPASDAQDARPSPGLMLRTAREQRQLSQAEVAARLNLRVSLIRDLELDRFDQKTASTFTRGYIKSYAKLLGIPDEPIVAAYEAMAEQTPEYGHQMHSFSRRTSREASENRLRYASWLAFIVLAVGMFAWWWHQPAETPKTSNLDDTMRMLDSSTESLAPTASASLPVASAAPAAEPVSAAQAAVSAAVSAAPAALPTAPVAAPTSATVAPAKAAAPVTVAETAGTAPGDGQLALTFKADCWLRITDASGKVLLEGLKKAGAQQTLSGKAPYRLVVGAPQSLSLSFAGEPVDMSKFKNGQVARFTLPSKS